MSDQLPPISRKVGLDNTEFKRGLSEMGRQIRVLESEFRASTASMGDWSKSTDGLEERMRSLNGQIDVQKQKVAALQDEYKAVVDVHGENSRAAQEFQIKLNKEVETLGKMQTELRQSEDALGDLSDKSGKAEKSSDNLKDSSSNLKDEIGKLGGAFKDAVTKIGNLGGKVAGAAGSVATAAGNLARNVAKVGLAAAGLATAAALGVGGLLASTVQPASDLAETANKINVVFGDASGAINDFAANAALTLGQTKQQALDAASTFGIFGKSAGLAGGDLASFSTDLVGLSSDLASFYNASPQDVIDALGAALRGESEPARKYGILLNEAALQAQALSMGLVQATGDTVKVKQAQLVADKAARKYAEAVDKYGEGSVQAAEAQAALEIAQEKLANTTEGTIPKLTDQQKIMAAYGVIMAQTSDAQGDFARTSDGLANGQRILSAQFENIRTTIGTGILPFAQKLFQVMNDLLASPLIQEGAQRLSDLLAQIGDKIATTFDNAGGLEGIFAIFKDSAIGQTIGQVVGYFKDLFAILTGSGGDIGKVADGIGDLVIKIIKNLVDSKLKFIEAGVDLLQSLADGIIQAIPTLIPIALEIIQKIVAFITDTLPQLLQAGIDILTALMDGLVQALPALAEAAAQLITKLVEFIAANLPTLIKLGVDLLLTLIDSIVENLPMLVQAGIDALLALVDGLTEALPRLIPAITDAILTITQTLIEHLPELVEAGGKLLIALANGLVAALPILIEKAPELIQALADAIIIILPILGQVALEVLKVLGKGIVDNLPALGEAAGKIVGTLVDFVERAAQTIWQIGKDIVTGIWQGIVDNKDWFLDQITQFFENMITAVQDTLGIHSPSAVFGAFGKNAGQSYIDNIQEALAKGSRKLQTAFGETALTLNAQPALATATAGAAAGPQTVNNFYLTANYPGQSPAGLASDVRLLQMLYGEA